MNTAAIGPGFEAKARWFRLLEYIMEKEGEEGHAGIHRVKDDRGRYALYSPAGSISSFINIGPVLFSWLDKRQIAFISVAGKPTEQTLGPHTGECNLQSDSLHSNSTHCPSLC